MQEIMASFKLEIGTQVNILPDLGYRKLKLKPKVSPTNITITGYSRTNMP